MAQSGPGVIEIFEDFTGPEWIIAETAASGSSGPFRVVGQGVADADAGITILESDATGGGLNGVAQMVSPNASDNDAIFFTTSMMFDVAKMGTIIAEARVRLPDLDTKEVFFGFSDLNTDTHSMEGVLIHGTGTTTTLTASDLVGFHFSSEYTDDDDWHGVYNGGTTTGQTASGSTDLNDDAVAGEFQVLRLELAPNGRVEWYIDGVLKQTVAGAGSTSVDLCLNVLVESKTSAVKTLDVDYIKVWANRDWTA